MKTLQVTNTKNDHSSTHVCIDFHEAVDLAEFVVDTLEKVMKLTRLEGVKRMFDSENETYINAYNEVLITVK